MIILTFTVTLLLISLISFILYMQIFSRTMKVLGKIKWIYFPYFQRYLKFFENYDITTHRTNCCDKVWYFSVNFLFRIYYTRNSKSEYYWALSLSCLENKLSGTGAFMKWNVFKTIFSFTKIDLFKLFIFNRSNSVNYIVLFYF